MKKAEHRRTDAFELWCCRRPLRVPWTAKIKPVNSKGSQPLIFIGRTDAETEALILQPPDGKSWLIGKGPDAGKDWGQKEKGAAAEEMGKMAQWTRVWANSRKWWKTGKPGMLQSMGLQKVGHNWPAEQKPATCLRSSLCRFLTSIWRCYCFLSEPFW